MILLKRCIVTMILSIIGAFGTLWAADWNPLPDTGQTTCYEVGGTVIPCPVEGETLYGQDANYSGPTPYYQGNGDGTVTDMHTNLMWQQGDSGYLSWQAAQDYCNNLLLANHTDWRMPERMELKSIVDYSRIDPSFPEIFTGNSYTQWCDVRQWTATISTQNSTQAWVVCNNDGGDTVIDKSILSGASVRCVRAAQ